MPSGKQNYVDQGRLWLKYETLIASVLESFIMIFRNFLVGLACVCNIAASVLRVPSDSILRLPSNSSLLQQPSKPFHHATSSSSPSLHAWPTNLPWTIPASGGLFLEFVLYTLPEIDAQMLPTIRTDLSTILHKINSLPINPNQYIDGRSFDGLYITLRFFAYDTTDMDDFWVSKRDAMNVVKTIIELFFVKREVPRQFIAAVGGKVRGREGWKGKVILEKGFMPWPPDAVGDV